MLLIKRNDFNLINTTANQYFSIKANECSSYKVLNSADRSQGNTDQNNVKCDQRDLSKITRNLPFLFTLSVAKLGNICVRSNVSLFSQALILC